MPSIKRTRTIDKSVQGLYGNGDSTRYSPFILLFHYRLFSLSEIAYGFC